MTDTSSTQTICGGLCKPLSFTTHMINVNTRIHMQWCMESHVLNSGFVATMFTAKTQPNTDKPSKRFSITTPSVTLSILATCEMLKLHMHPPHILSYIVSR